MPTLLDRYNYLSSFVHGGPYAERSMNESTNNDEVILRGKIIDWSNTLSIISIAIFLLSMTYENPDKYFPLFNKAYKPS